MGDLAIVALVGVIGLFLVFFFLMMFGVAVGIAVSVAVVVGCEKPQPQRQRRHRWRIGAPWVPLTHHVFVPFAVMKKQHDEACQTENPGTPAIVSDD
jgi:hypothetical protein